jgi:hypothetical protein
MVREVMDEARSLVREKPVFSAAILLMIAVGLGAHAAVFYEADGDELRLIAQKVQPTEEQEVLDPMIRMRSRITCPEKVPGFTVIVGLSHYNLELSVPVRDIHAFFESPRPSVAGLIQMLDLHSAA